MFPADVSNTWGILLGGRVLTAAMSNKLTLDALFIRAITPRLIKRKTQVHRSLGPNHVQTTWLPSNATSSLTRFPPRTREIKIAVFLELECQKNGPIFLLVCAWQHINLRTFDSVGGHNYIDRDSAQAGLK